MGTKGGPQGTGVGMSKRYPEWMKPGSVFHKNAQQAKKRKQEATADVILVVCRDDPECIPDDVYFMKGSEEMAKCSFMAKVVTHIQKKQRTKSSLL